MRLVQGCRTPRSVDLLTAKAKLDSPLFVSICVKSRLSFWCKAQRVQTNMIMIDDESEETRHVLTHIHSLPCNASLDHHHHHHSSTPAPTMAIDIPSTLPSQSIHLLVLQTLISNGFESASHQATLTLSTVLSRYLSLLGQQALDTAQDGGSRRVRLDDVLFAIENVGGVGVGLLNRVLADDLEKDQGRLNFDGTYTLKGQSSSFIRSSTR
jgi:hypothetical protein